MIHLPAGGLSLADTDSVKIHINKYFKSRRAAVTFAKNFRKNVNQSEILRLTTTTSLVEYEDSCVLTVTTVCWGGISVTMLQKLDELLNT